MKKRTNRLLSILIALMMMVTLLPIAAFAEGEDIASGTISGCPWRITSEGVLVIGNEGEEHTFNKIDSTITGYDNQIESIRFEGTVKAESMVQMFYLLKNVKSIDFTGLDTSNVTSMVEAFYYCQSLESLDLSVIDTSKVTSLQYTFSGCSSLKNLKINTTSVTSLNNAFVGTNLSQESIDGISTSKVTNMFGCFTDTKNEVLDLSKWDVSKVTTFGSMFNGAKAKTIIMTGWNTSSAEIMSGMFSRCEQLETLDVSMFDTKSVTNMASMFSDCYKLKELDLSKFVTTKVTVMSYMFLRMTALEKLDISNFDTSSVVNMQGMFCNIPKLKELDLSKFNTDNVENMEAMFRYSSGLKKINLSGIDTSKVTNMGTMFERCTGLKELDLTGLDMSSVTDFKNMLNLVPIFTVGENFSFKPGILGELEYTWEEDGEEYSESYLVEHYAADKMYGTYYETIPLNPQYRSNGTLSSGNLYEVHDPENKFTGYCINKNRGGVSHIYEKVEATESVIINELLPDGTGTYEDSYGYEPLGKNMEEALTTLIWFGFEIGQDNGGIQAKYGLSDLDYLDVTQQAIWDFTNRYDNKWGPENLTGAKLDAYNELTSKKFSEIEGFKKLFIYKAEDGKSQNLLCVEGVNDDEYGGFRIKKTDENGVPLSGAVFGVFAEEDEAGANVLITLTSKDSGTAGLYLFNRNAGLPIGEYYIKEIEAPKGYIASDWKRSFTIDYDQEFFSMTTLVNTKDPDYTGAGIVIKKTDAATGDVLEGTEFDIIDSTGTTVCTLITGINGIAKTGPRDLIPGTYTVKEVKAPTGYKLGTETKTVTVTAGDDGTYLNRLEFTDVRKKNDAVITAKKAVKNSEGDEYEYDMATFEFELVNSDGKVVDTVNSDKDGNITFTLKDLTTDDGFLNFTIREVKGEDTNIVYDSHEEQVSVIVRDAEGDDLDIEIVYDTDGALFENEYAGPVEYTVKHLKQTEDGTGYEEVTEDRETLSGMPGEMTEAAAKSYEGFKAQSFEQKEIMADGSTIVEIKYDREKVNITYVLNGGTYDGSTDDIVETYAKGTTISIHAAPEREGYKFLYWKGSEYQPGDEYTALEDHTFTAQWEEIKTDPEPEPDPDPETPKTGDESNILMWLCLLMMSAAIMTSILIQKKRNTAER